MENTGLIYNLILEGRMYDMLGVRLGTIGIIGLFITSVIYASYHSIHDSYVEPRANKIFVCIAGICILSLLGGLACSAIAASKPTIEDIKIIKEHNLDKSEH